MFTLSCCLTRILGDTALHLAARKGLKEVTEILLKHEPRVDIANKTNNLTAMNVAKEDLKEILSAYHSALVSNSSQKKRNLSIIFNNRRSFISQMEKKRKKDEEEAAITAALKAEEGEEQPQSDVKASGSLVK